MRRFSGRNDLNIAELFFQRVNYSVNAYQQEGSNLYIKPVNNFLFAERMLYGRVNQNHNIISINEANIKQIKSKKSPKKQLSALNFVVDAFEAMVVEMKSQALMGKLDKTDPYLYNIKAFRAFDSSKTMYLNYVNILKELFLNKFLNKELKEEIRDFDTFMPIFLDFIKLTAGNLTVTRGGYIASNLCSPMVSGLSIDVSDLDPSDDSVKQQVLDSPNFPYFVKVAKKYGFFIDKNIPWRITADIGNAAMLSYSAPYGATTESNVLNRYFDIVGGDDILDLQKMALNFYNQFVTREKTLRLYDGPKLTIICREKTTVDNLISSYSVEFWVDKYIDIVYLEKRRPGSPGAVVKLKKDCNQLLDRLPLKFVMSLIQDAFVGFDNFEGSFAKQHLKRINVRDRQDFKPKF